MKNKIKLFITLIVSLSIIPKVHAASMSISASSTNVKVGSTVTVNVSTSGAAGQFSITSSNGSVLSGGKTVWLDDSSESITFNSKSVGTSTITFKTLDVADTNANDYSNSRSITINVVDDSNKTTSNTNKTTTTKKEDNRSGNNDLKSFAIEDYNISPEFDKNTTDYTLTVPNGVEKIKILAYKDDDNASLSGDDGEVEVKVGENKFEVIVTAENGSKKTYNLVVTVEEKPITITIDNKQYSVIKNKEQLPELKLEHEDLTLTIQDQEVPAYRIDSINYVLLGLRDEKGKVNLYKFDSFKNDEQEPTYELFNYIESKGILLINKEIPKNKIPKNYKKYTEKINDYEYIVYKLNKDSKYSLIFGLNIETSKENIYKYDSKEKTLQIYDREEQKQIEEKNEKYEKLILILAGVIIVLVLLTTIGFTRKQKIKEIKNIDEDFLSKKDIKKIEKNTKKENKKNEKKQTKKEKKQKKDEE